MPEPDVTELVDRIRRGDAGAWQLLTDRYLNLLWSIARGLRLNDADAADAVQTTWLRLVENLDDIREPKRIGSWLATTVRRECLDIRRRTARVRPGEPETPGGWDGLAATTVDPLDVALLRDERDAALWRAFHALRPSCQRLLRVLLTDPAPSYAEVSAALDTPVGSIGPTRQRCLKCLRELLAQDAAFLGEQPPAADRAPAEDSRGEGRATR
ncbi:RNA polymerase sigma factor [Jidongwangia harbinensis]|uniref:RNA polymerase sigma factor n=1 Tax=Jidongwangia harbinensis TaxID=2878561 RepID=UPI001CD9CF08|nr:sigma-70 family RNA polymerase sigma factor [Jidongwangia harbinensis]MCA2213193.1 sigma-70 family RNA polymerase sigma factor [Jidongwangia harbinensis]